MSELEQFLIGTKVLCDDEICGILTGVVIDPINRVVAHLVVDDTDHRSSGRLVPVELVDTAALDLRLRCSVAAFAQLPRAEEKQFLSEDAFDGAYGPVQALSWPYFAQAGGGMGLGLGGMGPGGMGLRLGDPPMVTVDRVPLGEVEVHRGDQVHASDGYIGSVKGLVVDPNDHQVTHVLLGEGHLWGRKDVAIPISAVLAVSRSKDGIALSMTKQEVHDLPAW